jgi:hypothetical protein
LIEINVHRTSVGEGTASDGGVNRPVRRVREREIEAWR